MQTTFMNGTDCRIINKLNIPYGYLSDYPEIAIMSLEQGRDLIKHRVDSHGLSNDDAMPIDEAMVGAGLLVDDTAVVEMIKAHQLPETNSDKGEFTFQVHTNCTGNPLPHGHVHAPNNGRTVAQYIHIVDDALPGISTNVTNNNVRVDNAISLLQQMIEADLPVNRADSKKRFSALPEEVREEFGSPMPMMSDFPGELKLIMVMLLSDALASAMVDDDGPFSRPRR